MPAPVVLIHGLAGSSRSFDRLVPLLGDREALAVDLPGHGVHAGDEGARSVEAMADAVPIGARSIVVGHSMGGLVATALAASSPDLVDRLILVNSPPTVASRLTANSGGERVLRMPVAGPLLWRALTDAMRRDGAATAVAPGAEVPDVFVQDAQRLRWTAFSRATGAVDAYLATRTLHDRVAAVDVPVTVVFGERDRRVALRSLEDYDDTVEIVRIPGAGHSPMWEAPERVAAVIH